MDIPTFKESKEAVVTGTATPLHRFIYDNEPAGQRDEIRFRYELQAVINYIKESDA